jgi:uncharacterized protein (DUF58 family)
VTSRLRTTARLDARRLRVLARRDVATGLVGAYRSAFRGRGLIFDELTDYEPGDDVRWIEWNATARFARPIVKRMREERDLVVGVLVDVSSSLSFGSNGVGKRVSVLRAAAALAAAAVSAQDRVALCTFSSGVHVRIDPGRGPVHLERILRALADAPSGAPTDATEALHWAAHVLPRHSLVFVISDLVFPDPGATLRRSARKHDLVVLRIQDPADELPHITPVRTVAIEGRSKRLLRHRPRSAPTETHDGITESGLRGLGIDVGTLRTGSQLVASLRTFLESRAGGAA